METRNRRSRAGLEKGLSPSHAGSIWEECEQVVSWVPIYRRMRRRPRYALTATIIEIALCVCALLFVPYLLPNPGVIWVFMSIILFLALGCFWLYSRLIITMAPDVIRPMKILFAGVNVALVAATPVHAESIGLYWGQPTAALGVYRANFDGTSAVNVLSGREPNTIKISENLRKLYFYDGTGGHTGLYRANLDGSDIEWLLPHVPIWDFEIDSLHGQLFGTSGERIFRMNLDGSNFSVVATYQNTVALGIALDPEAEQIYWGSSPQHMIRRVKYDGSNLTDVLVFGSNVEVPDIEFDPLTHQLYWLLKGSERSINRANADGSNRNVLVSGQSGRRLAVNQDIQKLYWSDQGIFRANLDGSDMENVIPNGFDLSNQDTDAHGIAFGPFVGMPVPEPVPEPSTWLLLTTGIISLLGYRWRWCQRTHKPGRTRMTHQSCALLTMPAPNHRVHLTPGSAVRLW